MFQHFIITRFNLRRADWKTTKNSDEVLSETWLKNRFTLFENYCILSVKKQKNQNFKWLVFLGINTPEIYKEKIEEVNTMDYIITSRLDNDDSLHSN